MHNRRWSARMRISCTSAMFEQLAWTSERDVRRPPNIFEWRDGSAVTRIFGNERDEMKTNENIILLETIEMERNGDAASKEQSDVYYGIGR